jgi:hypothetical protein
MSMIAASHCPISTLIGAPAYPARLAAGSLPVSPPADAACPGNCPANNDQPGRRRP